MSRRTNNNQRPTRSPSLSLVFYLDLLENIRSAKQVEKPLTDVNAVVEKFSEQKGGILLDTVWSILANLGDLKRYQHYYDLFKKAALADFKGFVESMNSAYTIANLPASHPDRKYTIKVVNNLQIFDLPNSGVHVKNVIRFFNSVTQDLPDNTTRDSDTLNLVRVLIFLIVHTFRILAIENRPSDSNARHQHEHGPNCNHDHEHNSEHDHEHPGEHQHGPDCNHDHELEDHGGEAEHQHGPDCNHDQDQTQVEGETIVTSPKPEELTAEKTPDIATPGQPPEAPPAEVVKCPVCKKEEPKMKCEKCGQVNYCNKKCARKDGPEHQLVCATLKRKNNNKK